MTARTYKDTPLDDAIICMAAFKCDSYAIPLRLSALIAGGTPVMASNPQIDVSAIRYDAIPPHPATYAQLRERDIVPHTHDRIMFAWSKDAVATAPRDRVVGCVKLEDLTAALEQIRTYQSHGLAPERIVVAGTVSSLPDEAYDQLTATGVLLEEMDWNRHGEGGKYRLERVLRPFYRTLLGLGPTFENITSRPYNYTPAPTLASDAELRRIGELLREDEEMYD